MAFNTDLVEIQGFKSSSGYFKEKTFLSVDEINERIQSRELNETGEKMKFHIMRFNSDIFLRFPVAFPVTGLHHTTTFNCMRTILVSKSFKGREHDKSRKELLELSFWAADVSSSDIEKAREEAYTYVLTHGPQSVEKFREEITQQFANSPAFNKSASRYGNFRFSLPFSDLLSLYGSQFCDGEKPELSILGTDMYKQEIVYHVVVHIPDNQRFTDHPRVPSLQTRGEPLPFVYWMDETLYWRPQSTSEDLRVLTTNYNISRSPNRKVGEKYYNTEKCVWNQLGIAFYIPPGGGFRIPLKTRIDKLSACEILEPFMKNDWEILPKSTAEELINQVKEQKRRTRTTKSSDAT